MPAKWLLSGYFTDRMNPLFPDVGVIGLVPDSWGLSVWQPRHHVLTRLSRYFHVLWVDQALGWRDFWLPGADRPSADLNRAAVPENFEVYPSSRWTPEIYKPAPAASLLRFLRLREARKRLVRKGCKKILLYLWRPAFRYALDFSRADLVCYHIDDEYTFSDADLPIQADELEMLRRSDQVVVHSRELVRKKGSLNPNVVYVPNGVAFDLYASPQPEPEELRQLPHPRVGYVGVIKKHLDLRLLLEVASRHPEMGFIFVGPFGGLGGAADLVTALKQLPNVRFFGRKPVAQLPAYMQHVDICMLPYLRNDYTRYIFPMKLHEYLATGRPVIGTPIPALEQFAGAISLAGTADEWSAALAENCLPAALSERQVLERRRIARNYDWNVLVSTIAMELCRHLGPGYVSQMKTDLYHRAAPDGGSSRITRLVTAK